MFVDPFCECFLLNCISFVCSIIECKHNVFEHIRHPIETPPMKSKSPNRSRWIENKEVTAQMWKKRRRKKKVNKMILHKNWNFILIWWNVQYWLNWFVGVHVREFTTIFLSRQFFFSLVLSVHSFFCFVFLVSFWRNDSSSNIGHWF